MKVILLLIPAFFIFPSTLKAQSTSYPKGLYKSYEELLTQSPSDSSTFLLNKNEDNSCSFEDPRKLIKKSDIKNSIIAYSDGDKLYLNCNIYGIQSGYAPILLEGQILAFRARPAKDSRLRKEQYIRQPSSFSPTSLIVGQLGGALAAGIIGGLEGIDTNNVPGYIYYLELEEPIIHTATVDTMGDILNKDQDLFNDYLAEKNLDSDEVLLKYIMKLNQLK